MKERLSLLSMIGAFMVVVLVGIFHDITMEVVLFRGMVGGAVFWVLGFWLGSLLEDVIPQVEAEDGGQEGDDEGASASNEVSQAHSESEAIEAGKVGA